MSPTAKKTVAPKKTSTPAKKKPASIDRVYPPPKRKAGEKPLPVKKSRLILDDDFDVPVTKSNPSKKIANKPEEHWKKTYGGYILFSTILLTVINGYQIYNLSLNLWLAGINLVLILLTFGGTSTKCPSCSAWWAVNTLNSETLNSWIEYHDVEREDVTRSKRGDIISTTNRKEQIIVPRSHLKFNKMCQVCGYKYSEEGVV